MTRRRTERTLILGGLAILLVRGVGGVTVLCGVPTALVAGGVLALGVFFFAILYGGLAARGKIVGDDDREI